jgi:N-acetyl-gamma-glutamyl-phosphate reductase
MIVSVPLQLWSLPGSPDGSRVHAALADYYAGCGGARGVTVASLEESDGMRDKLDAEVLNDTDGMTVHVFRNEERQQAIVCAVLDNLGKGASGQAVHNLNLMLGLPETADLEAAAASR